MAEDLKPNDLTQQQNRHPCPDPDLTKGIYFLSKRKERALDGKDEENYEKEVERA